jgi:TolA-binding protein
LNVPPYVSLKPKNVLNSLSYDIDRLNDSIRDIKIEIEELQNPVNLKAMLKSMRL